MISALRGRCPGPLDECGTGGAPEAGPPERAEFYQPRTGQPEIHDGRHVESCESRQSGLAVESLARWLLAQYQ